MSRIRQLAYYALRVAKQTILHILLGLDLVAALVIYFAQVKVPAWVFGVIPIIAVFWAGFNIYRQGTADARIVFLDQDEAEFDCVSKPESPRYQFRGAVYGHIMNFGPQTGVLEDISYEVGFNDIYDSFVLNRMLFDSTVSSLHRGKISPWDSAGPDTRIDLPLVLSPGQIEPFTLFTTTGISIGPYEESIWEALHWLECINLNVSYLVRQSDGVDRREVKLRIRTRDMFEAALASDRGV